MALRAIVYNFIKDQAEIIQRLVDAHEIELIEWFCYPPFGTANIKDFADVRYRNEMAFGLGEEVYDEVYKAFPVFADMHQRRYPYFQNTIFDTWNEFNVQFGVVYKLLTDTRPDVVLFGNIPHGGHDYLLYKTAKALGIRTLVLFQVPICPRFMILESIERFGEPESMQDGTEAEITDPPPLAVPVYMSNPVPRPDSIRQILRKIRNPKIGLHALVQRTRYTEFVKEAASAASELPEGIRFIYFPLHLQPEMTTSAIGGVYADQLLAVERLARKIPDDVRIVVKENPKQNEYQRPASFFRRLREMGNVIMLTSSYDTYKLIERCEFVATITGTAGWEAINMGKPALVFGNTWYQSLPGVVKYGPAFDYAAVRDSRIGKDALATAYRKLMGKTWPGIVQTIYFKLVPGIDIHENNTRVAAAIAARLRNRSAML